MIQLVRGSSTIPSKRLFGFRTEISATCKEIDEEETACREHWLCASRWDGTLHPTVHFYSALGTEPHLAEFTELWHARVETERPRKAQDAESTASQAAEEWRGGGGKRPWNPGRASIPRKPRVFLGGKSKGGRWGACGFRN
ncbi:unnamed protein product [Rangifer tarandus platyrhynchus]|uniref:Uncharacterized protein n=1 Tax=Rangifer tarandus platyrhynchus TaxID=3082113 RepID=A0AC60A7L8_RANTA